MALNTLVYRLRRDLVNAGIDASALIQRAPGGGATRFGLADGEQAFRRAADPDVLKVLFEVCDDA